MILSQCLIWLVTDDVGEGDGLVVAGGPLYRQRVSGNHDRRTGAAVIRHWREATMKYHELPTNYHKIRNQFRVKVGL